jgi:Xaa-Pro aminopeptidase
MTLSDIHDGIAGLRQEMKRQDLAAFIVPHEDAYLNEYTRPADGRLEWLTGFTGSAGVAVILADGAAILSDARYIAQIRRECPMDLFEVFDLVDLSWREYATRHASGGRIGFDARLHSVEAATLLRATASAAGATVVALAGNPIDGIWNDRPPEKPRPAQPHPPELAGEASSAKRQRLAARLDGCAATVIATCDNTAWLLNLRGDDIPRIPVPLCRALLHADGRTELFIESAALDSKLRESLGADVAIHAPTDLPARLDALNGQRVLVDPALTPDWIETRLRASGCEVVHGADPVSLAKAVKNGTEIAGFRAAHRRDGAAFVTLLHWIDQHAISGAIDELGVVQKLEELRGRQNNYRGQSFASVSAVGANAAFPHYNPTPQTNRKLAAGEVFLIDAGAQFVDGTTDMTRTVPIGPPQAEHIRSYTLVVKAHIGHARLRFPAGIGAMHIDACARQHLWQAGWDYGHGTAHLVGSFLKVHEGPLYMHWRRGNTVPVLPGMLLADEPAHYRDGRYGVRVENILLVHEPSPVPDGDIPMASFEAISLAPIDRRLLDVALLTSEEIAWLNDYHARVEQELSGLLEPEVTAWLRQMTLPLSAA